MFLKFTEKTKPAKEDIDKLVQAMNDQKLASQDIATPKRAVYIGRGPPSSLCEKHIAFLQSSIHIEYFEEKDLIVNITEHELVPLHTVLSDEQKKELLKR